MHFEHFAQGGRLVVLDREPRSYQGESRETQMQRFQIALSTVEDEIRQSGFEVISREDCFIDRPAAARPGYRPDDHVWWLLLARKPYLPRKLTIVEYRLLAVEERSVWSSWTVHGSNISAAPLISVGKSAPRKR